MKRERDHNSSQTATSRRSPLPAMGVLVAALVLLAVVGTACTGGPPPVPTASKVGATSVPPTPVTANQAKAETIRVSVQRSYEAFFTWQGIQEGLAKQLGLDVKFVMFDSGMPQVEALASNQWDVGYVGNVPMLVGAMRYNDLMIASTNVDSPGNCVLVRPDSPALKTKSFNPRFPEVLGRPEDVKGKTVLVTAVSAGHYAMSKWLETMGLKDSDVTIQNLEPDEAVAAFKAGKGDFVVLWTPFVFKGLAYGWKIIADGGTVGANIPLAVISSHRFVDRNPELTARWLTMNYMMTERMKREGVGLAEPYRKFMKDFAGVNITAEDARMDILRHPPFTIQEARKIFDASSGRSEIEGWMTEIADFFTAQGRFKPEERDAALKSGYITDKFLKMVSY